ncbi:uncharacterized protein METZ01_LOCUS458717, partial [marine metagenome]
MRDQTPLSVFNSRNITLLKNLIQDHQYR